MNRRHIHRGRGLAGCAAGVAAAAMFGGLLCELVDAPLAHADDYSTIVADIQGAEALGQTDLGDAATAFAAGDYLQGLNDTFIGTDDITVAPGFFALLGTVDSVTGAALPDPTIIDFDGIGAPPASYADAVAEVANFSAIGQESLTAAGEAFATGDLSGGVFDEVAATAFLGIIDPEVLTLGLVSGF